VLKHLLIPLDGSRLAESVLPAAKYLADRFGAWVTLVHVIEKNAPGEVHGDTHLQTPEQAEAYLAGLARSAFSTGTRVEYHVHTAEVDNVSQSIADHAGEFETDLVVMCTHGKGGPREWIFGTIAQQIVNSRRTPVLLIPAAGDRAASVEFRCHAVLVPLDTDPDHETSLPIVTRMASTCGAPVHLLVVVPTFDTISGDNTIPTKLLPGTTSHMLDMAVEEAEDYLKEQKQALQKAGVLVTTDVLRGDPAHVIGETAAQIKADLIVMGTHGTKGADAFWSGSVTAKVCRKCGLPLLMVPVGDNRGSAES